MYRPRWFPVGSSPLGDFFWNMIKMMYFNVKIIILCIFNVFLNEIFHEILKKIRFSIRFHENIMKKIWFFWIKYPKCVSLYTLNPINTMCTTLKFKCIFRSQFSPDAVGRRRPALRLRSFPRGCPPQAKIFSKKT